jgi:hypothetical protein
MLGLKQNRHLVRDAAGFCILQNSGFFFLNRMKNYQ